jgi:hypothetical protein
MRTMSSLPDLKVYQAAEEMRKQKEEELKDVEGLVLCMSFQPISSSAMNATITKGGSPMSVPTQNHQCTQFPLLIISCQPEQHTDIQQGSS